MTAPAEEGYCGLCGRLLPWAMIESELHACCGCGWSDPAQDGTEWSCPSCSPVLPAVTPC